MPKQETMLLNGQEMSKVTNVNYVPSVWRKQNTNETILTCLQLMPVGTRRLGVVTCIQCARFQLCEVVNLCLSATSVSNNVVYL